MIRSLFLLVLALGLAACDFAAVGDSVDDFRLILGLEAQSTVVGGLVVDAATGDLVEAPVRVTYEAPPGLVVDGFGDPIAEETVEGGAFNFAIANDRAPAPGRAVSVTVRVEAEGFLPQRRVVALADTGAYDVTLRMLAPERPPEGAETGTGGTGTGSGGATEEDVTVSSGGTTTTGGGSEGGSDGGGSDGGGTTTSATVVQGTVFTDENGDPLTGAVTVSVTDIDPGSAAFEAAPELDGGDVAVAAFLVTVRAGGQEAAAASGDGIRVSVALPTGAVDPATGGPFVAGETVEALAFDAEAGAWQPARPGTVVATAGGGLAIEGRFVTVGDVVAFVREAVPMVSVTVRVDRNGNEGPVRAQVAAQGASASQTIPEGQTSATFEIPANAARTKTGASFGGRFTSAADPTACTDCQVVLPPPPPDILIVQVPECPSASQRVYVTNLPAYTTSAREHGETEWFSVGGSPRLVHAADGSVERIEVVTNALRVGVTYDIKVAYLGLSQQATYTVPPGGVIEGTFEAPAAICQ